MEYLKAGVIGFFAAVVTFILVKLLIIGGWAPFNLYPQAALFAVAGLELFYLPLIYYFFTGIGWSLLVAWLFQNNTSLGKGLGLGVFLWLIMNLLGAPLIGWGFFGSRAGQELAVPFQLDSTLTFLLLTLALDLIYGGLVGWLNGLWLDFSGDVGAQIRQHSEE